PGTSLMLGPKRGAHQNGPAGAAMAEARTCFVFSVHREEIWALDRGMAADHRGLWPRKAYGHRELPEVRAWHGSRPRQRTRRLDARRQRRQSLKHIAALAAAPAAAGWHHRPGPASCSRAAGLEALLAGRQVGGGGFFGRVAGGATIRARPGGRPGTGRRIAG